MNAELKYGPQTAEVEAPDEERGRLAEVVLAAWAGWPDEMDGAHPAVTIAVAVSAAGYRKVKATEAAPLTNTMKYGPQTPEVEALLARISTLTATEAQALDRVLDVAPDVAWYTVWDEALYAARHATGRDAARNRVRDVALSLVWHSALGPVWDTVWGTVWGASFALVLRDLITPDRFTQAHYDLLTGPWRKVIGKVHPDDAEVL